MVHYFTKLGAGEYYLEELEETVCMAEEKLKEKRQNGAKSSEAQNGNGNAGNNAQDSVSQSSFWWQIEHDKELDMLWHLFIEQICE